MNTNIYKACMNTKYVRLVDKIISPRNAYPPRVSCVLCAEFIISFTEEMYRFAEGELSAEVCLEGVGEITQETTATLSSLAVGTATGIW